MKKRYLLVLLAIIVAASSTVSAGLFDSSDLTSHNFDGKFTMDVPKDVDFAQTTEDETTLYLDSHIPLCVIYAESDSIEDSTIDFFYQGFTQDGTFTKTGTDGNLTLFDVNDSNLGTHAAAVHTNGKVVIVCGDNTDEVKEMASSVKFN